MTCICELICKGGGTNTTRVLQHLKGKFHMWIWLPYFLKLQWVMCKCKFTYKREHSFTYIITACKYGDLCPRVVLGASNIAHETIWIMILQLQPNKDEEIVKIMSCVKAFTNKGRPQKDIGWCKRCIFLCDCVSGTPLLTPTKQNKRAQQWYHLFSQLPKCALVEMLIGRIGSSN